MSGIIALLLSQLSIVLFAGALFAHPLVRALPWRSRFGLTFLAGAVILTFDGTVLSLLHLSWGERTLPLPVIVVSLFLIARWRRRTVEPLALVDGVAARSAYAAASLLLIVAVAYFALTSLFGISSSVDYALFWAIKGAHFAEARGLDPAFLQWPFSIHTHQNYPQLFPMTLAWSSLLVKDAMLSFGHLSGVLWLIAVLPVMHTLFRTRLDQERALASTTMWGVAMAASLSFSYSSGNAEPPLVAYASVALLALLIELSSPTHRSFARFVTLIALSGMLMTKLEGGVLFAFMAIGWLISALIRNRHALVKRALRLWFPPIGVAASWWLFQIVHSIPFSDAAREKTLDFHFTHIPEIVNGMLINLSAGTYGLSWVLPLIFLLMRPKRLAALMPALSVVLGSLLFYFVYYLHSADDPSALIGWTLPRVSQPALSALIIAAALASFGPRNEIETEGVTSVTA